MKRKIGWRNFTRRDFLKLAAVTAVAVPTLTGLDLLYESQGELPNADELSENSQVTSSDAAPNQPILIVHNDSGENPFGSYLGEILRAEGINSFSIVKLSELDFDSLREYDIVIFSDGPLSEDQADQVSNYVFKGGRLVVMNPDPALLPILGLKDQQEISKQAYIVTERNHPLASGIATVSLQYHGSARNCLLDGAQAIAWLCDKDGESKDHPAISINQYGDGWACAWTYDLTKSVVLTRQGNPEWADQERDGFSDIRPSDMFYGWIDLDRIEIPQADEQQRLLVNVIHFLSQNGRPLPRLWYFPDKSKGMVIATSDTHQNPGWAVERVIEHAEKHGGHISIYSMPPFYSAPKRAAQKVRWWLEDLHVMDEAYFPSPARVADWRARGHEFGIHPLIEGDYVESWETNWKRYTGVGYGLPSPTMRVHRILWNGWVDPAKLQASYGIRMNLDFYHVGDGFRKENGEWVYGHFTGSGLPMRFVDENGKILNIYQQLTQLADDHILNLHWGGSVKIPAEQAVLVSKGMIDRSLAGRYAAIGAIFHTDPFAVGEQWATEEGKWMDGTLQYAADNGVPIWSAEMWLDFVEARRDTSIENIVWLPSESRLTFTLDVPRVRSGAMSVLLPLEHLATHLLGVDINGKTAAFVKHTLGAQQYAWVEVPEGENVVEAHYEK